MNRKITRQPSPRSVTMGLVAGLLCCLPSNNLYPQTSVETNVVVVSDGSSPTNASPGYAGAASAVMGFAQLGPVSGASTYLLSLTGDAQEASDLELSLVSDIDASVSHAAVVSQSEGTSAQASAADIRLTGCSGFWGGGVTTITADFVMSEANAACSTNGAAFSGESQISGLAVDGQPVAVTGQAGQFVFLSGGGFMVINEQLTGQASLMVDGKSVTADGIAVNALHVILPCAGVNVVFGSSAAGIGCGNETNSFAANQVCDDFTTGGGWITGTPSGAKANFGVAGGVKQGAFWGHLDYIDDGNGMHVKHTAVTGYSVDPNDANCRLISYAVTIDGQPGTADVHLCDLGEPGGNDRFEIQLSNGYSASGDLGGSQPGGGNIQLHECQNGEIAN